MLRGIEKTEVDLLVNLWKKLALFFYVCVYILGNEFETVNEKAIFP